MVCVVLTQVGNGDIHAVAAIESNLSLMALAAREASEGGRLDGVRSIWVRALDCRW